MSTWSDVAIVALNLAALCFIIWCLTRSSKP